MMTNSDALALAIQTLTEKREQYTLSLKPTNLPVGDTPPIVRKHRWKYRQLTSAIEVLTQLRKESPK